MYTDFLRLLSDTMHSTSSNRQLVHGGPCSTTLQRTLRARQHWQALEALLFTLLVGRVPLGFRPASVDVRLLLAGSLVCTSTVSEGDDEASDMACSDMAMEPMFAKRRPSHRPDSKAVKLGEGEVR